MNEALGDSAISFAISVPIGAYHPLLPECIASLVAQRPKPAIAVLNASDDARVRAVLDEYNAHFTYRRDGPDAGQTDAILEGWANTQSTYIGWLNADDMLYPNALKKTAEHFQNNSDTDLYYGHSVVIDDDEAIKGYHWAVEPPSERLLTGDIISQPSCFFRRDAHDRIGGLNRDLHFTMDWDLWVRLWRAGARFRFEDAVFSRVLWSKEAKTGGFGRIRRKELNRIIDESGSLTARFKSRVGFSLHHLFEYVMPNAVTQLVRNRTSGFRGSVGGIKRSGAIGERAWLPMAHFSTIDKKGVRLTLAGGSAPIAIEAGAIQRTIGRGSHDLIFSSAITAGEVINLRFGRVTDGRLRLVKIEWL